MEAREEFLSSFEVNGRMNRVDGEGETGPGEYRWVFDDGNLRCTATWGETRVDLVSVDGAVTRMSGTPERWQSALIEKNNSPSVPWGVPIHRFLTEVYHRKLSAFCREIATGAVVEGNQIVVEAIRSDDDPTHEFRVRVFLRPDQNYAFVGVDRSIRAKGTDTWDSHEKVRMSGLREYRSSGYFLPSQVSYSLYAKFAPGSTLVGNGAPFAPGAAANPALAPRKIVAYQGELSDWVLPAQVSSDTFAVSIPDGVNVHDDLRGLNYIKATVGDKELSEQLSPRRRWAHWVKNHEFGSPAEAWEACPSTVGHRSEMAQILFDLLESVKNPDVRLQILGAIQASHIVEKRMEPLIKRSLDSPYADEVTMAESILRLYAKDQASEY